MVGMEGYLIGIALEKEWATAFDIVPRTFCLELLDLGVHNITVSSGLIASEASLDADAGSNYFYEATATSGGFSAKPSLCVDLFETVSKIMVQQNKRVKGNEE